MFKRLFGRSAPPTPPPDDPPASRGSVADVTDATFAAALEQSGLVVVDFWAEWCQPCEVMSAWVEFLARDFATGPAGPFTALALDVDANPRTAEAQNILGLPTLIYYRSGAEVHRTTGITTYDDLRRLTARLLKNEGAE